MERKEYFEVLKETSRLVTPLIFQCLEKRNFQEPVKSLVEILPKRRSKNPRLRDLLLRLSYEISRGEDWKQVIPPYAAAIELYNCSTYIVNWFLDGKGELKSQDDEKSAITSGFLLRELAQEIVSKQKISKEKTLEILCGLSKVNFDMYQGQTLDLYVLTVDNFDKFRDEKDFLETLYKKGRLVCGHFSSWIVDTGVTLADEGGKYRDVLRNFAINLSSGIQLANDAGDFIPACQTVKTPDKTYKDQVTDIANGRLTLPTWYCLKHGTEEQKSALLNLVGRRNAILEEQEKAVYALRDCGAFNFVISEANRLTNLCKSTLHKLPESPQRELLSTMTSLIRTNKFYNTLRENYRTVA